jgi:2-oxoglutarate ferredoxin oxidoreductase subunit delta
MDDWALPTIRLERCTGCGLCVTYCPTHAVEMVETRASGAQEVVRRPVITRPQECAYCGTCEELCPESAIVLTYEIVSSPPRQDPGQQNLTFDV